MRFDFFTDRFRATLEGEAGLERMLGELDAGLPSSLSVVGNATSLLAERHGTAIDKRATIRFNLAQIVDPVAQGARWDFVASSNIQTLRYYREHEPAYTHLIYTAHVDVHLRKLAELGSARPVLQYPLRLSRELLDACGARPTTGMQILYLLDRLGRKDVAIFGFDWKETPTFYEPGRKRDPHRHDRERQLGGALIERNGWQLF